MNRKNIVQARITGDLAADLAAEVERTRAANATATESVVVRALLSEAIAARRGRPPSVADAGYKEGWLRGYSEAKRAMQEAASKSAPFTRPRRPPGGST